MRNVRLILFALFSYLLLFQLISVVSGLGRGLRDRADFRQLYVAGYLARTGHGVDLYDYGVEERLQNQLVAPGMPLPFDHLAYEALLYAPFSILPYSAAYLAFAIFNFLLLVLAGRLFRPYLAPLAALGKFVPDALFFGFIPLVVTLVLGQDSIVLLVLAVLAFLAIEQGHDARSGLILSLGLFKFQYILPVVLLFFLWRRWRLVLGAAAGGIGVTAVSLLIAGLSGMRMFGRTMIEMSAGLTTHAQQLKFGTYPSAMPNLRGFIETVAASRFPHGAIQFGVIAATLAVILFAARMQPSLPLAILVAVLVSYHGLIHDCSMLVLPVGLALVQSLSETDVMLGVLDILLFASPAILLQFFHGRFYPMALVLLALLFLWRRAPRATASRWASAAP